MPAKKKIIHQKIVFTALSGAKKDEAVVNKFFAEKKWGKVKYVQEFNTLPGKGGPGGRTDVIFDWSGTPEELSRFAVQRFGMGSNAPSWIEDYAENNRAIIPDDVYVEVKHKKKLKELS